MIQIEGVTKVYGKRTVLQPTSLTVAQGQSLALIGTSGCGKSTLLRLVIGLIRPDSGTVALEGTIITPQNIREIRLRMGYVIQDGGLFPHLTSAQNVTLMARLGGWDKPRMAARLKELAGLVQLPTDLLDRFPAELSGGQRQRVGIMRALMLDPKVLLMDEPMGALDPIVRNSLQQDLRKIFKDLGKTVIMVTHDMAEAAYLGDEIALMRTGELVQRGPLQELVEHPADDFVREFLQAQHADALCAG
jgi:osmoprotectant transport system ATP-binding protein